MRLWHMFLVVLILINSAGLGLIYWRLERLSHQFPYDLLQSSLKAQDEINLKLTSLQNLVSTTLPLKPSTGVLGIADLLPDKVKEATSSPSTFVFAPKGSTSVQVYKEQAEFSAVLGQLVPEYNYPYYTKVNDWYLVMLNNGKTGWVKSSLVSETP